MINPTYEGPIDVAAALGRSVVRVPPTAKYGADVKKLVQEADRARGGLIYLCNPNNPTSSVTPKADIAWLIANLPADTIALIDEAYLHFAETSEMESALGYVRQGKNVLVSRSFSKIYGMAGLRAGFVCGRQDLMEKMAPFGIMSSQLWRCARCWRRSKNPRLFADAEGEVRQDSRRTLRLAARTRSNLI